MQNFKNVPQKLQSEVENKLSYISNVTNDVLDQAIAWVNNETSYKYVSLTMLALLKLNIKDKCTTLSELWDVDMNRLCELIQITIGKCTILNDGTRLMVIGLELPHRWFMLDRDCKYEQECWNVAMTVI